MHTEPERQLQAAPAAGRSPQGGDLADWLRLADDMIVAGEALAGAAEADRGSGPQITGLALLARSIGHMRAVPVLIQAGRIIEARTITRNLLENMFLAVALNEDGTATLAKLIADHRASRLKRAKLIADNQTSFAPDEIALVEAHMETLAKGHFLTASGVAKGTSVREAYLIYAQLSGDSAHPSFDALNRHVVKDDAGRPVELSLDAELEANEPRDTVGWACMALLGTLVAIQELTSAAEASPQIHAIGEAYLRCLARQPGAAA